jgi:hypothetical protein
MCQPSETQPKSINYHEGFLWSRIKGPRKDVTFIFSCVLNAKFNLYVSSKVRQASYYMDEGQLDEQSTNCKIKSTFTYA